MAYTTSPRAQNISESDFFAKYKPPHLRSAAKSVPKVVSKVTIALRTPPPESDRTPDRSSSKLSPIAAPFIAPRTPPSEPARTLHPCRSSSKLSPTAAPFISPTSLSLEPARVTCPSRSPSKLSPDAAPFTMPAVSVTPKVLNEEEVLDPIERNVIVGGNSGPWPQYGVPCNDENLVTVTGLHQDDLEFDDCVSEAGLENQPRQAVRATEGNDATNQLLDWDGKHWAPVPSSWEHDRAEFDGAFIPNYIREWAESVPSGKIVTVDTSNEAFLLGQAPIDNGVLIAPFSQPITLRSRTLCS